VPVQTAPLKNINSSADKGIKKMQKKKTPGMANKQLTGELGSKKATQ
jgi:hypothetical protein